MAKGPKLAFRILFFLYLAGMLFLCFWHFDSLSAASQTLLGIPLDKLMHFTMFLPFPVLAFLSFDPYTETVKRTLFFVGITLVVGLVLAAGTEWGQATFTDYRKGDPLDFVADAIGLVLSCAGVAVWDILKQKKR